MDRIKALMEGYCKTDKNNAQYILFNFKFKQLLSACIILFPQTAQVQVQAQIGKPKLVL